MCGYEGEFSIGALQAAYQRGLSPLDTIEAAYRRIEQAQDNPIWIRTRARERSLELAQRLQRTSRDSLPLYGIPFAVKDNIDVAELPTTAACPAFSYMPQASASVVHSLEAAGAICLGKTNLDQFATGLVGTRSPYGVCHNAFDARFISGGSSSGSALAVSLEHVSFALGTDTAGSGRVPAAFNNIVGLKPTPGLLSTRGVVPACRSLDCVSIFALDCADAMRVLECAAGFDAEDPFSRRIEPLPEDSGKHFRFAIPRPGQLEFFGDGDYESLFAGAVERLVGIGGEPVEIDLEPFLEAQRLLYEGPWLAERQVAFGDFAQAHPDAVHPIVRQVLAAAGGISAADAFRAMYRLAELRRATDAALAPMSALLLPTAPTIYSIEAVQAEPLELNARLGLYANFVNLLGFGAVSIPAGFRRDGLPFGVCMIGPAGSESRLASLGGRLHGALGIGSGASKRARPLAPPPQALRAPRAVRVAVVGAHLSGMPLNSQLTERGASLVARTHTAPRYRLYALGAATPDAVQRPGMVRVGPGTPGACIEVEVWEMPMDRFGTFVAEVPAPLGIATIELDDGEQVKGFVCEQYASSNAEDITAWGGWRHWVNRSRTRNGP